MFNEHAVWYEYVWINEHASMVWICMTINEHTVCACICMTINKHVCALCSSEVPVCILLAYRLRGMQLLNHEYIFQNNSGSNEIKKSALKSRNPLWNPEIPLKSVHFSAFLLSGLRSNLTTENRVRNFNFISTESRNPGNHFWISDCSVYWKLSNLIQYIISGF